MGNSAANWRIPTKSEVKSLLDALRQHSSLQEPHIDIKGSCWTSEPYQGSQDTCWVADFDPHPKFEPFFGSHDLTHGYACACLRLVAQMCRPDPSQDVRLIERDDIIVDHHTGLAWQKNLMGIDGRPTDHAPHVWVGRWLDAAAAVKRFNELCDQHTNHQLMKETPMHTLLVKHDGQGGFEVVGTDGPPIRVILLEDDHMDAANIQVDGRRYIGIEHTAQSKPELVAKAIGTFSPLD
jgi:hypothetical protein